MGFLITNAAQQAQYSSMLVKYVKKTLSANVSMLKQGLYYFLKYFLIQLLAWLKASTLQQPHTASSQCAK
jgi:hypothetical protein